ncbi:MAG: vitamin K epoxide reductase family protein [Ilumatobacter sp.]|uniref:vitamin K epoxide reductase family protein n=1 Tax=Ilumatobacter sp. TaxID=1967498 RepID=UPI00391C7B1D
MHVGISGLEQSQERPVAPVRGMAFGWLLLTLGSLGVAMAAVLLVEKVRILQDPSYVPSCSINPILSCGSIMNTPQAEAFGFPNPIIGLAGFAVVATAGAAVIAGAQFARWFWRALLAGSAAGVVFVHWLIFQSLYRIGALCPYCMVVWAVTIAVFWYTLLHVLASVTSDTTTPRWYRWTVSYHGVVLTGWFLAVGGLITVRFWYYWATLA